MAFITCHTPPRPRSAPPSASQAHLTTNAPTTTSYKPPPSLRTPQTKTRTCMRSENEGRRAEGES
eukprot:3519472-Rhodomonas_salina.1